MSELERGVVYRGDWDWDLTSGSRAEGLTLEDEWGYDDSDTDVMWLYGGPLGVYVTGGQQARGRSCMDFRPEGCSPAYCKLQISDLHGLKSTVLGLYSWFDETCVEESDGVTWLNTYNTVRCMKDSFSYRRDDPVSGPASQRGNRDTVNTLVCSAAHPDLHHEFRSRTRGPWPTADVINYILRLPMLLVLVGHKLSPKFRLEARISWSHLEYKLIKELPESVRQGYIAYKYIMKRFLKAHRALGATARSYRRQDGADAAARFEKFLSAHASLRPPISLKFTTEKHGGMVHTVPKRQTLTLSHFCTIIPERFAARRR